MRVICARLLGALLGFLMPGGGRHRPYADPYPYSCEYVGGPTVRRIGGRPARGEDSPLVRPYLVAHERRLADEAQAREAAEVRQRRVLWLAVRGVDFGDPAMKGALPGSHSMRFPALNSVRTEENLRAGAVA